jgi:hypothetical protein
MTARRRPQDEGAALALALVLTLIGLIVGSSLMLLSQTETYASANYQSMTQARFAAESGVHKAINFLLNNYTQPTAVGTDAMSAYNIAVTPVTYTNQPVVLSARTDVTANYPVAATQSAFNTAAHGTLTAGTGTLQYSASAQLIAMRLVYTYGTGASQAVQTWLITGVGTTGGARPATVEVSATLETQAMPFNLYGLFATGGTCGALKFGGGGVTNSYDSSNITFVSGKPATTNNYGSVGTNGNLTEVGNSVINGSLSTPRSGVGNCSAGAVDALTQTGQAQVTGGVVQLPQAVTYPTPAAPSPAPATGNQNINSSTACAGSGFAAASCSGAAGNLVLDPLGGTLQGADVKLTGGTTLHLKAGSYSFNSISLQGNSNLVVDSGPVILNITGTGQTTPIDLSGGTATNASYIPKKLQILYGGTGNVKIAGGAAASMMVFAPNSAVTLTGGSDLYGAVLGKTIDDGGGTSIHYDRDLPTEFFVAWNTMMSSFSWKKY